MNEWLKPLVCRYHHFFSYATTVASAGFEIFLFDFFLLSLDFSLYILIENDIPHIICEILSVIDVYRTQTGIAWVGNWNNKKFVVIAFRLNHHGSQISYFNLLLSTHLFALKKFRFLMNFGVLDRRMRGGKFSSCFNPPMFFHCTFEALEIEFFGNFSSNCFFNKYRREPKGAINWNFFHIHFKLQQKNSQEIVQTWMATRDQVKKNWIFISSFMSAKLIELDLYAFFHQT